MFAQQHTHTTLTTLDLMHTYLYLWTTILVCRAYLYIYKITRERETEGERGCLFISRRYLSKYTEHTLHINVCNSLFLLLFLLQTVTSGMMEGRRVGSLYLSCTRTYTIGGYRPMCIRRAWKGRYVMEWNGEVKPVKPVFRIYLGLEL